MKKNIVVIYGGNSSEHDISILTALQAINNMDKTIYNIYPIYIARSGVFYCGKSLFFIDTYQNFNARIKGLSEVCFLAGKPLFMQKMLGCFIKKTKVDCALICLHGLNGEDGTIASLMQLSFIPYTSSGLISSAVCMDKVYMKNIFSANNFDITKYENFDICDFVADENLILTKIALKLNYPLIVKPANLGSSIGISKAYNEESLKSAILVAGEYDNKIIVEEAVEDLREINCSAMTIDGKIYASSLEEPVSWDKFLSFDDKYIGAKQNKTKVLYEAEIDLTDEVKKSIKEITKNAYKIFDCKGVVRIDYLFDNASKKLYINEINSIPGSLAYYLWKEQGLSLETLIDKLIDEAIIKHNLAQKHKYLFESSALKIYSQKSFSKAKSKQIKL